VWKGIVVEACHCLLTLCGIAGCLYLYNETRAKDATIQQWNVSYLELLQKTGHEIQRLKEMQKLKLLSRTTPADKKEKPRPKGRG
jgi:hypothetical protein